MLAPIEPKFPTVFAGLSLLPDLYQTTSSIIQASRVDQALCDEAEHGRIHGSGVAVAGCWMLPNGRVRIHLNRGFQLAARPQIGGHLFDFFSGGQPLIEGNTLLGGIRPLNGDIGGALFLYLWASAGADTWNTHDMFGLILAEYTQAATLGAQWKLSGDWGDRNRLSRESNWHEDVSLLTTNGDSRGSWYRVDDAAGKPQYAVEILSLGSYRYLLPFRYLKRAGFTGPRRVFFPPEENIAIWYLRPPNEGISNIILTASPDLMLLNANMSTDALIGCLPGGISSISKTDITTLKGKRCWIPVFSENNKQEVEFAVKLSTRLRQEYMIPHIAVLGENGLKDAPLEILVKLAEKHKIAVPRELQSEFLGDLTQAIANYIPTPIIDGMLNTGELMLVHERELPPFLMAAHIAKQLNAGENVFGSFWPIAAKLRTLTIIDQTQLSFAARYRPAGSVMNCDFLNLPEDDRMKVFRTLLADAQVVIIAASELICDHPTDCLEVIQVCLAKQISVIILVDADLPAKLLRMISKKVITSRIAGKSNLAIALADDEATSSIEVEFNAEGALLTARLLSEEEREQVAPGKTVASHPPDIQKLLSAMQH